MRWSRTLTIVDAHAEGEIGRVITGGVLEVPGATMRDKLRWLNAEGEVGGPYGTAQGAVLFQVTARTAWDPEEFAAARAATRERLEQERLGRLLDALIEQRKLELGVNYDAAIVEELGLAGPAAPA